MYIDAVIDLTLDLLDRTWSGDDSVTQAFHNGYADMLRAYETGYYAGSEDRHGWMNLSKSDVNVNIDYIPGHRPEPQRAPKGLGDQPVVHEWDAQF